MARLSVAAAGLISNTVLTCLKVSHPVRYGIDGASLLHLWIEKVGEGLVRDGTA